MNSNKTLRWLLNAIDTGGIVLPEMQRGFVWKRKAVQELFDSLYRQLPIGNILLWTAPQRHRPTKFKGSPVHNGSSQFHGYLLDGQQRLTAVRLVRDNDDEFPLMFRAHPVRDKDEAIFHYRKRDEWSVPVCEILSPTFNGIEWMKRFKKVEGYSYEIDSKVQDELQKVKGLMDTNLVVVEYDGSDYAEAMRLFIRINSAGRPLKEDNLWAAELSHVAETLLGGPIADATGRFPGFRFTVPFLVKCLVAVHRGQMPKGRSIFSEDTAGDLRKAWAKTEKGLDATVRLLSAELKWQHLSLVPSVNALIPLVYVAAHDSKGLSGTNAQEARRWLVLSSMRRGFSGSVYTELNRILRQLSKNGASLSTLSKGRASWVKPLKQADFDTGSTSGAAMSLYVSMLREHDARDWYCPSLKLDGTVVGKNAALHVHHFFPRALLKSHNEDAQWINYFPNYVLLNAQTNYEIGKREPSDYLSGLKGMDRQLTKQCIPLDRSLWTYERYDDFLRERVKLLVKSGNEYLFGE